MKNEGDRLDQLYLQTEGPLMSTWFPPVSSLVSFSGRLSRQQYWAVILVILVAGLIFRILTNHDDSTLFEIGFTLIISVPLLALTTQRLHDIGMSGKLQLIPIGLGLLSQLLGILFDEADSLLSVAGAPRLLTLVLYWASALWIFGLTMMASHDANEYGPAPRGKK